MIYAELYEQLCQFPLLRIAVFLVFLSLLVEIFYLYIYPWIKSDIEDEITNMAQLNLSVHKSLQEEKLQTERLLFQKQKLEKINANLSLWRQKMQEKQTLYLIKRKDLQEALEKKMARSGENLNFCKIQKKLANECLKNINAQSINNGFLLDSFLKKLRG